MSGRDKQESSRKKNSEISCSQSEKQPEKQPEKFRLNRAVALTGLASRRKADELIAQGQVKVNGVVVKDFSFMVSLQDKIEVGRDSAPLLSFEYIALNKPKGIVSTCEDERGRKCLIDLLPEELKHLKPVGRLDRDSEGLILLTNDGEFTKILTHPSHDIPKVYRVTVKGKLEQSHLRQLASGVKLSDGMTRAAKVRKISANYDSTTFEIAIKEGRNRQIRRMCATLGYDVTRLVRVAIGGLQLSQLPSGKWRRLTDREISQEIFNR
jgi:23S rRNA pseudouridine2605 synthase